MQDIIPALIFVVACLVGYLFGLAHMTRQLVYFMILSVVLYAIVKILFRYLWYSRGRPISFTQDDLDRIAAAGRKGAEAGARFRAIATEAKILGKMPIIEYKSHVESLSHDPETCDVCISMRKQKEGFILCPCGEWFRPDSPEQITCENCGMLTKDVVAEIQADLTKDESDAMKFAEHRPSPIEVSCVETGPPLTEDELQDRALDAMVDDHLENDPTYGRDDELDPQGGEKF